MEMISVYTAEGPDLVMTHYCVLGNQPRMKADQTYPPVVGVSVMRHRHGLKNEAAEKRLLAEL